MRGDQEPGVVVDDVEDLDVAAPRELPVGDVGLPPLVRLVGLEADERAFGTFLGLGGDEAPPGEDPPDCRWRGGVPVPPPEVESDRVGTRV